MKKKLFTAGVFALICYAIFYVFTNWQDLLSETGEVQTLGISSDGKYVISAHRWKNDKRKDKTKLVLWNIDKRKKKLLRKM